MNIDRAVLVFAGCMVLASAALAYDVSPYWLLLDGLCRAEHGTVRLHRILPRGYCFQGPGLPQRRGVPLALVGLAEHAVQQAGTS